jgi:succinoglycan biosynthesis transport protein ExoP
MSIKQNQMNTNRPVEPAAGMSVCDLYYVIFRHKWKIILLSLTGFALASAIYFFKPPPYESQAALLIKYVPAATQLTLLGDNEKMLMPDSRGDDIINSEINILTSLDIAEEAVTNIGVTNILGRVGAANPASAAIMVRNNLEAVPANKGSSVIVVTFKHSNPQIVQPVLQEIINDYFQKHYEIHSTAGQFDDALTREQSALSAQLQATEQQLADLKNSANVISLDDSRKDLADQLSKIQGAQLDAQAELSGYESAVKLENHNQPPAPAATNTPMVIPPAQVDIYSDLRARLDTLRKMEQGYLVQGFTHSNALVQEVEGKIASVEKTKIDLETTYPQIASQATMSPSVTGQAAGPHTDEAAERAQMASLQAKIKAWGEQLNQLQTQATNLNNVAPMIAQLEQTRDIQQANYQNLSVSLEKSHIDEALDTGKSPNIKWVQMPSPPGQDWKKTYKIIGMVAFGGIAAGLAWAFLLEFYLDSSVKRPFEVEAGLKLALFLSIPDLSRNGHARRLKIAERQRLRLASQTNGHGPALNNDAVPSRNGGVEVVSLEKNRALEPYYEALRDRLIVDFEIKGLTHKPKLVAVTSAGRGAGVSTLAAGLAASFSKTGDGHVLLVDMNVEEGAAQQFFKGKAACSLDSALEKETKNEALVQENLYVVTENSDNGNLPRVLPRRFASLISKFKASDYDYIIFDVPPVSQTSVTLRVARFMDMVLLVIESEKTDRETVRRVAGQLEGSGATLSAVLNKTHDYIPARLSLEFSGEH